MRTYTPAEARKFFRSYGAECKENEVEEWMENTPTISRGKEVDEWDLYAFNDWIRCKGTSFEPGMDDQTKIARLLEENKVLKNENEALKEKIHDLENQLRILPF